MTYAYDLELFVVALERLTSAAQNLVKRHPVEDWLAHRLEKICAEAKSLKDVIVTHN